MYTTVKSLNNNLVLVTDEHQEELILFGKGIGFKKKKGDAITSDLIVKIYQMKGSQPVSILDEISPEVLSVTGKIIQLGEEGLNQKLSSTILISLADHLQFAIERNQMNTQLSENTLQWEIKFLYYKEFELGKKALELVKEELGIDLPEAEASFIALHFVNAQDDQESKNETLLIAKITKSMVKIIQSLFNVSLNKESINYSRFVTHIRYFMNRQLHNKVEAKQSDGKLYLIIQEQYQKSYACALMIRELLKKEYNLVISDDEMIYLIIHIERVVSEAK
ncbi:PRD domain-containing protein [Enterococcus sp. 5H]|uniref:PRD domain-containing protein n=1 Tax=Enterococcus sp. 5H TaxID=1229490 RepID=UPI0023023135|nr:PRD domain-containing protein [Enterococcus sp. 5H]MDA9471570.1 Beta-glucoside bgl operon antiterminator, BglG family [Enterococcus sp. 5H]